MVTTTRRTVDRTNGATNNGVGLSSDNGCAGFQTLKKKTAAKDVRICVSQKLERGMFPSLWVTWSLGIIVRRLRLDRSLTHEVFRFLGDGGDLVAKSPFERAKQLLRRTAEVSALTLQPQVLLSKASPGVTH